MRKDKKELLQKTLKLFQDMQSMIERMIAGESEASLCKEYNVNNKFFRRLCFEPKLGFIDNKPEKEDIVKYLVTPEELIYCDVFELDAIKDYYDVPIRLDEVMKIALSVLTENERDVMKYKYWEDMTFDKIGEKMGITRSRTQQLHSHAIKKLRTPKVAWVLRYGKDALDKVNKIREVKYDELVSEEVKRLEEETDLALRLNNRKKLVELKSCISAKLGDNSISKELYDFYIENIGLSTRTTNCLIRNEITTVGKLAEQTEDSLMKLSAFGSGCLGEVKKLLKDYNVELKEC